jgi:hypothetical protein
MQISDVASPCRYKGRLMSDYTLDRIDTVDFGKILDLSIDVWECYGCGAIAFGNHIDNKIVWYNPETSPDQPLMVRSEQVKKENDRQTMAKAVATVREF